MRRGKETREEGIGITEIVVAVVIIIFALLGSGLAIGNAFEAQATNESRNKAVAIAQDRISQAQLVSFTDIGFPQGKAESDQMAGGLGGIVEYNGEAMVILDVEELAFNVPPYEEVTVGKTNLDVSTYVTKIRENSFDGTISTFSAGDLSPRRVTIVVQWESQTGTQNVVRSLVRYPNPVECAPLYAVSNLSNAPEGCTNE